MHGQDQCKGSLRGRIHWLTTAEFSTNNYAGAKIEPKLSNGAKIMVVSILLSASHHLLTTWRAFFGLITSPTQPVPPFNQPTNPSTSEAFNQQSLQPKKPSTNEALNQPSLQPTKPSTNQLLNHPTLQSTNPSTYQPFNQPNL